MKVGKSKEIVYKNTILKTESGKIVRAEIGEGAKVR